MFSVYILYSSAYQKTYCGYTSHLLRRIEEHNITATKGYTIRYRPWVLIHSEFYTKKEQALTREKYYKTGVGREQIQKLILQFNNQII